MHYKYRFLQENLITPPHGFGALLITGPRQAGKSTLANKLLQEWGGDSFFSFDTPDEIGRFRRDPVLFMQNLPCPAVLDEVQNVPEIFRYVKSVIDKERSSSCKFILTGSQQFQMMRRVSESLAGRVLIRSLYPFTVAESNEVDAARVREHIDVLLQDKLPDSRGCNKQSFLKAKTLWERILCGGYPALAELKGDAKKRDWIRSYIQTYIQRDVRDLSNIHDLGVFNRFVNLVAGRTSQIVNYSELGKDIGLSFKTAQHYLSILDASYIWTTLPAYAARVERRLVKSPKGLFVDSGLACFLCGIFSTESLLASPLLGNIFESFVVSELIKSFSALTIDAQFYHFRTAAGAEVDLVIEHNGRPVPVEIKSSATPNSSWGKGIGTFFETIKPKRKGIGFVISLHPEIVQISKEAVNLPFQLFC